MWWKLFLQMDQKCDRFSRLVEYIRSTYSLINRLLKMPNKPKIAFNLFILSEVKGYRWKVYENQDYLIQRILVFGIPPLCLSITMSKKNLYSLYCNYASVKFQIIILYKYILGSLLWKIYWKDNKNQRPFLDPTFCTKIYRKIFSPKHRGTNIPVINVSTSYVHFYWGLFHEGIW